jgi:hypothetical protein
MSDPVKYPAHYTWIPGIECKDITKHFLSMPGSAIKYIWRYQFKGKPIEDLNKAIQCLEYEIERLTHESAHARSDKPSQEVDRTQGDGAERLDADKGMAKAMRDKQPGTVVRSLCMEHGERCLSSSTCCQHCQSDSKWTQVASEGQGTGFLDK